MHLSARQTISKQITQNGGRINSFHLFSVFRHHAPMRISEPFLCLLLLCTSFNVSPDLLTKGRQVCAHGIKVGHQFQKQGICFSRCPVFISCYENPRPLLAKFRIPTRKCHPLGGIFIQNDSFIKDLLFQFQKSVFCRRPIEAALNTGFCPTLRWAA